MTQTYKEEIAEAVAADDYETAFLCLMDGTVDLAIARINHAAAEGQTGYLPGGPE